MVKPVVVATRSRSSANSVVTSSTKPTAKYQLLPLFPGVHPNHNSLCKHTFGSYEEDSSPSHVFASINEMATSPAADLHEKTININLNFFISGNSVCIGVNLTKSALKPLVEIPQDEWHNMKVVLSPNGKPRI